MKNELELSNKKFGKWTILSKDGLKQWNCICECGTIRSISAGNLLRKKTTQCRKCSNKGTSLKNKIDEKLVFWRNVFRKYSYMAKKEDRQFLLSISELISLCSQNCHYCNIPPTRNYATYNKINRASIKNGYIVNKDTIIKYIVDRNGIDRKDNSVGYTVLNVVPCCKKCNFLKKAYSYEEFLNIIETIYNNRIRR